MAYAKPTIHRQHPHHLLNDLASAQSAVEVGGDLATLYIAPTTVEPLAEPPRDFGGATHQ